MLSALPMRASLTVAPLSIHKNESTSASDDASLNSLHHTVSSSSSSTLTARGGNSYTQSQMTPPATPTGSQEYYSNDQNTATNTVTNTLSNTENMTITRIQQQPQPQPPPPPPFHNFLRAYYAFHPSYSPADSTVTLPMNEGDVILVHSVHANGWADGTLLASGARGWLPTNYCDAYEPDEMQSLLHSLLNFWDLMRSTTVNDNEIFGNQEFMKGIIAGVRYLLERTHCLTRESPLIQRHEGLRRGRKLLLSELSSLVKCAKRLQEQQRFPDPNENVNNIVDEMILKAFKIVVRAVRFCDVLEDDRLQYAQAMALSAAQPIVQPITVMETVQEENIVPPTPPADSLTFDGQRKALVTSGSEPAIASPTGLTVSGVNKRFSSMSASYQNRLSYSGTANSLASHRVSTSSMSHRVSLAGPSPLSQPHNLVSHRLNDTHDTFLSYLGSFIGRLNLQTQSRPQLALAIKQSATSGGQLLVVVDIVSSHDSLSREILQHSRSAVSDRIIKLVRLAGDILTNNVHDVEDFIIPQDNGHLITAATDCVKATGECVAKTKWVIERIGDFEYEFDESMVALGIDLSLLDAIVASTPVAMNTTTDHAASAASSSDEENTVEKRASSDSSSGSATGAVTIAAPAEVPEPSVAATPSVPRIRPLSSADMPTPEMRRISAPHAKTLSVDKPLPEVPQGGSSADQVRRSRQYSAPTRPQSMIVENVSKTNSMISMSSLRPRLPPLPRLSTTLSRDEYSPIEKSATNESEMTSSFRSESLTVESSGTNSTSASRDSESSLVSQTSTRATTPDNAQVPKNQPSLSELSATGSAVAEEADEDVESKLLGRTYAHELMFNKEGQVTGGSLPALVERLTTHESTPDAVFVATFYLTFRLFCTPVKLTEALIDRFEYVGDSPHMAAAVRLRVYNVFKGWLESHWRDESDREALPLIEPFAEQRLSTVLPSVGQRLVELVQRVSSTDGTLVPRLLSSMGRTNTANLGPYITLDAPLPPPILSKALMNGLANWKMGGTIPSIMDFDALEMARQLTMRQMNIFGCIMPEELLGSLWMKNSGARSPNVKAMTGLSTDISNLVAETILSHVEVKKRAAVIKQWIKVAHQCYELHNYDALMAIICSLNSSTIVRLRRTWDLVSPKRREMLKTLQSVVETAQNNKVLRGLLHDHVPPCLPFLGMYLTDLAFVDIGNPATKQLPGQDNVDHSNHGNEMDHDGSNGLTVVNFDKHSRTAKIIGELQRFQIPYRLTEVPDIQEWIGEQISKVRELAATQGDNVQVSYYRKSLLLEPREAHVFKSVVDAGNAAASTATPAIKKPSQTDLFSWMRGGNSTASAANSANSANVI